MNAGLVGWLIPGMPLVGGLLGLGLPAGDQQRDDDGDLVGGPRRVAAVIGVAGAAIALLVTVFLLIFADRPIEVSRQWVSLGGIDITVGFSAGVAALVVALAVCVVACCVQVYSVAYLDDDSRYAPYAAQISLFTGAMLLVVTSGDLFELLIGWEVMGVCSYLLIGHDRRLQEAPAAAVKAFLVTRVGDVGILLGFAALVVDAGSSRISVVLGHDYSPTTLTVALLLVLAGVAGKSAQFPLHTWLPDAMAGPTPISALIHAATMVAAGVYLVFRLYPLFEQAPTALATLGVLAAVTIVLGALSATAQDDLKRVLAWSTVSQIGYLTGALAVGSPAAALFHLLTHAAFKALLFLAAGAVIHAVGSNSLARMGGLRARMPVTFWSFVVGLGALAGVPPLAGFWSKETVLTAAERATHGGGPTPVWVAWLVWGAALLTVGITAWYATRLLLLAFFGISRAHGPDGPHWLIGFDDAHHHKPTEVHDPPGLMRWPILLLTLPAALLGLAEYAPAFRRALGLDDPHFSLAVILPVLLLLLGAGAAYWQWRTVPGGDPAVVLGRARPLVAAGLRLDAVQDRLVVRPVRALAAAVTAVDEQVIDAAVEGTGSTTSRLGRRLADGHRIALPDAAVLVLAGVLVLTVVAACWGATA